MVPCREWIRGPGALRAASGETFRPARGPDAPACLAVPGALLGAVLASILAAGCAPARMELPGALEAVPPLEVDGRQGWRIGQRLRFGEFEVRDIDRSATSAPSLRIQNLELSRARQSYAFVVGEGGAATWKGECSAALSRRAVDLGRYGEVAGIDRSALACELRPLAAPGESWRLELHEEGETPLTGALAAGTVRIDVVGTRRLAGTRLPAGQTTGYRLLRNGTVLGAVEVIDDGAVWLPAAAGDERALLAAVAAALLLHDDLRAQAEPE